MDTLNTTSTLLQRPEHIISLSKSGILVHADVRVWTATMQDSAISDEVTSAKNVDRDAGKFVKHLLSKCEEHKKCMNYRQIVYNWAQKRTYDWAGSMRLLPAIDYPKFMQEYATHQATFQQLVDDFLDKYPNIVANIAFTQQSMFNRSEYPTPEEVRNKFSIHLYRAEVPTGDFRCSIMDDSVDDLSRNYERQARDLIQTILTRQKEQLIDIMQTIATNCTTETVTENGEIKVKRKKLYESTLNRARELIDTFSKFNITADPALEQARAQFEQVLDGMTIDKLRESDTARINVQDGINDILSKFNI